MKPSFAQKATEMVGSYANPTVLGLDPLLSYIPPQIMTSARRLACTEEEQIYHALFEFNKTLIDACADLIPLVKFQLACYEQYGLMGLKALRDSLQYAQKAGLLTIADGKRNDIGTSASCYSKAFLSPVELINENKQCFFAADALTVNGYLGSDGIKPFITAAVAEGKGCFVLVRTSNPSAVELQDLILADGRKVYEAMADLVASWGVELGGNDEFSPLGAVVGATWPSQAAELRQRMPRQIFLIPGYGAQGGGAQAAVAGFNKFGRGGLVNASRSLMLAYQAQSLPATALASACRTEAIAMRSALREALKYANN